MARTRWHCAPLCSSSNAIYRFRRGRSREFEWINISKHEKKLRFTDRHSWLFSPETSTPKPGAKSKNVPLNISFFFAFCRAKYLELVDLYSENCTFKISATIEGGLGEGNERITGDRGDKNNTVCSNKDPDSISNSYSNLKHCSQVG